MFEIRIFLFYRLHCVLSAYVSFLLHNLLYACSCVCPSTSHAGAKWAGRYLASRMSASTGSAGKWDTCLLHQHLLTSAQSPRCSSRPSACVSCDRYNGLKYSPPLPLICTTARAPSPLPPTRAAPHPHAGSLSSLLPFRLTKTVSEAIAWC